MNNKGDGPPSSGSNPNGPNSIGLRENSLSGVSTGGTSQSGFSAKAGLKPAGVVPKLAQPKFQPKAPRQEEAIVLEDDDWNILKSKGSLSAKAFFTLLGGLMLFNLFVYAIIKGLVQPARQVLDVEKMATLYGIWFVLCLASFYLLTNVFLKRWARILGRPVTSGWKSFLRLCMLSPTLSVPLLLITSLFTFNGAVPERPPKWLIAKMILGALVLTQVAVMLMPSKIFDNRKYAILASMKQVLPAGSQIPFLIPDGMLAGMYPYLTPTQRYFYWLGTDWIRAATLAKHADDPASSLCKSKLTYLGAEVQDCYFGSFRKMADVAPFASPFAILWFETKYRTRVLGTGFGDAGAAAMNASGSESSAADGIESTGDPEKDAAIRLAAQAQMEMLAQRELAQKAFAGTLLMVSNQLELLEASPYFKSRRRFTAPHWLIQALGSPEVPMIEAGQDFQRYYVAEKIYPVIKFQLENIEQKFADARDKMGPIAVDIDAALRDVNFRIQQIKADPMLIRHE
ncbi:MAG TPA: hypothetical protein PLZ57_15915 [Pseudobdellovibrionaceae bacterium]|nr:hypothetical protein [Pseudobdellovibrionaceae bacterium]